MKQLNEIERLTQWKKIYTFDVWHEYAQYLTHLFDVLHNELRLTRGAKTIRHLDEKGNERSRTTQDFAEQMARLQGELDAVAKVMNYHKRTKDKLRET